MSCRTAPDPHPHPPCTPQRAVSQCLPPLMAPLAADREYMDGLVQRLLNTCTKGKSYGERCASDCSFSYSFLQPV